MNIYNKLWKIVAAFGGMHVSSAEHRYARLPRKCDYRIDRRRIKWSLCAAMLCRRHKTYAPAARKSGKSYFQRNKHSRGHKVVDLGVIQKGIIKGVCMQNMKSLSLLWLKNYNEGKSWQTDDARAY